MKKLGEEPREAPRRPVAERLAHDEAQIESTDVDEQPLEDVLTMAQMDTTHCACLQTVSEGSFQQLTALAL